MTNQYPWSSNTTPPIASQDDPRYETPGGAQNKIEQSLQDSKEYTDERLSLPELPIHNGAIVERHIRDENVSSRTIAQKAVTLNKMSDDALSGSNHSYEGQVNANTVTEAIDTLDDRVQYFIDNSGTSVAELLDARLPATGPAFPNVRDRLNKSDAQLADTAYVANRTTLNLRRGITSHRGLQAIAPENTIRAIAEAGRRGYVLVEIDPQRTSDGVWILMHDATVDRTTDGTGTVSMMTWAQIQGLKIDYPASLISADEIYRVPTLEDALKEIAYWGMGVNIDGSKFIVNQENITYIAGLLDKYGLTEKSWIVGPTYANRQVIKTYAPNVAVGWTTAVENVDADIAEAAQYKAALLAINSVTLTAEAIAKCNAAGVFIMAYTANDLKTAYQWLNRGVSFVETDYVLPGSVV